MATKVRDCGLVYGKIVSTAHDLTGNPNLQETGTYGGLRLVVHARGNERS